MYDIHNTRMELPNFVVCILIYWLIGYKEGV